MNALSGCRRFFRLSIAAAVVFAVPALAQPGAAPAPAVEAASPTDIAAPPQEASGTNNSDYVLGVSDKVRITVYNEKNLSGEFPINANGTVSMPLVGDVKAAGITADALRVNIEKALADGYLKHPRVAIDVLTFRPYYILGEVTKAGEYPYSSGLTVLNAVATAQGFTYRANKKYVFIKHAGQTAEDRVRLTDGLPVQPGDTLRIGERFF